MSKHEATAKAICFPTFKIEITQYETISRVGANLKGLEHLALQVASIL